MDKKFLIQNTYMWTTISLVGILIIGMALIFQQMVNFAGNLKAEVMLPLDIVHDTIDKGLSWIAFLIVLVTIVGVILVIFVFRRLKITSLGNQKEKENAEKLSQELQATNQQLREINQKLKVNEQQMKESNQEIRVSQDMLIKKKEVTEETANKLLVKTNRLNRFQSLLVGREHDMIKLKQEINELLQKLGQPKKFQSLEEFKKEKELKRG